MKQVGLKTKMGPVLQHQGTPMRAKVYYAMEDAVIASVDTDSVFPPLDAGTIRKINSSNLLEQNRFEKYRHQLQKEKEDAKLRFFVRKQDFVRSSVVIQEQNIRFFKRKFKLISENGKEQERLQAENLHECRLIPSSKDFSGSRNTRENSLDIEEDFLLRPPYFLPPLYKNIILDVKEVKKRKERQDGKCWLNITTADDMKDCRYLRIAGRKKSAV